METTADTRPENNTPASAPSTAVPPMATTAGSSAPPTTAAIDPIIPPGMEMHFEAAKSAKLLAVNGMAHGGCGWLSLRLLADWLRRCDATAVGDTEKSGVGAVIFSLRHGFDYYANHMAQLGIDLKLLEARGHFIFLGDLLQRLLGDATTTPPTPPSLTLLASLQLLMAEANKIKATHERSVLLLDEPEFTMPLFEEDTARIQQWILLVQGASYQFHNAIVSMMQQLPNMKNRDPRSFPASIDAISGIQAVAYDTDMVMAVRAAPASNMGYDGTVRVEYRDDYEPPSDDFECFEEGLVYKIKPDGRSVEIITTYY